MDVEDRVDELYRLAPEQFTEARNALAKELRAGGDREAAARVKQLRKPTVAAWALNQLAHRQPGELQQLREAGEELARQQRRVLSGLDRSDLRTAQQQRRTRADQLEAHARDVLRHAGVAAEAHIDAVRQALDAAVLDAQAGEAILQGRLARPPEPPSGFGDLSALSAMPSDPPEPSPAADPSGALLVEARERLDTAEAAARERRAEADDAAQAARNAAQEVADRERELARARQRAAAAARQADEAAGRAESAEATVARCQHDLTRAEAEADGA